MVLTITDVIQAMLCLVLYLDDDALVCWYGHFAAPSV